MEAVLNNKLIPLAHFIAQTKEVFETVRKSGTRIIADEGKAACVLMPAEEYMRLVDEASDRAIERIAAERLSKPLREEDFIPQEEIDKEFGITDKDLEGWEEVEIE
ncbi:MAG: hypothetical protein IJ631_03395 [Schwartzia sp.]|nr:hypothetical protein [Schwartzia sp. (in: firmicutes)]